MNDKRTIIIAGAGAAIPWGAPTTADITKTLLSDKTFRSYTGQPIGDWLNHQLTGLYHRDPDTVNFETIINAVEYLATFFASKHRESVAKFKNLMPAFFEEKDNIWEILWFDRIYKSDMGSWQSHNERYKFNSSWDDYDYFFENVFRYFINLIIKQVEIYSNTIDDKTELNNSLNDFLYSIKNPLRCYTINYDRIFPKVYKGNMFEGFTKNLKFDLKKVLTDDTSNTYYNMHGSVHYELDWPGNVKYAPERFVYDFGHGASNKTDQDNRKILNSNIITGFNKTSRILANPYLQFYLRFYQDCLFADKIYIVGYSFSDIHINNAIKTASLANKDMKIICISYMLYNKDIDKETEYDWITLEGREKNFLSKEFSYNIFESIADRSNIDRILIYRKGFEQYLKKRQWKK